MESRNVIRGRLLAPLYITVGACGLLDAFSRLESGVLVVALVCGGALAFGLVALVVPWDRVPDWAFSGVPYVGVTGILVVQLATPELMPLAYLGIAANFVWAGACLRRVELVVLMVVAFPVVVIPRIEPDGLAEAVALGVRRGADRRGHRLRPELVPGAGRLGHDGDAGGAAGQRRGAPGRAARAGAARRGAGPGDGRGAGPARGRAVVVRGPGGPAHGVDA